MGKKREKQQIKLNKKSSRSKGKIFLLTLFLVLAAGTGILFWQYDRLKRSEEMPMKGNSASVPSGTGEVSKQRTSSETEPLLDKLMKEAGKTDRSITGNMKSDVEREREEEVGKSRYGELLADADEMKRSNIHAVEAASKERIVMDFAGDILFDPGYSVMSKVKQSGGSISAGISDSLLEEMRSADLMMLNNEFPFSDRGTPTPGKQYTFRAPTAYTSYLTDMGVDLVSLANNHAYDFGESALLDTIDALDAQGIWHVGAGKNLEEASKTISFVINDTRIAILSATQIERKDSPDTKGATDSAPGVFRCWDPTLLLQRIAEAKEENDFVFVYVHWGTEKQETTDWAQDEQALKIVQAGADLIIGDHPHVLQPMEFIEDVPVIYSLGNFWFNSRPLDTCILQVVIENGGLSVKVLPARQQNCYTSLLNGTEKTRVLTYLNSISRTGYLDNEGFLKKNP